MEPEISLSCV